jgi:hypothetical protein
VKVSFGQNALPNIFFACRSTMRANPVNPPGRAGGEECCTLPTAFISSPASTFADVVCPTPESKINPTNRPVSSQTDFFHLWMK